MEFRGVLFRSRSGFRLNVSLTRELGRVTCMINQPEQGTEWFDVLHAQREAIEHDFGGPLMWDPLPEQKRSLIRTVVTGGWHLADRKRVVSGMSVSVRVDMCGRWLTNKKKDNK